MDKLKMHSADFVEKNIANLAELFPNCVTEVQNASGRLQKGIDFDQLRQELSHAIVEGPRERFRLDWPGKREAILAANAPILKTLRPNRDSSVEFNGTKNMFIEGDNLDALKLLQEGYLNSVKMIYLDPPYNRGSDLVYADSFQESSKEYLERSSQVSDSGERLQANTDANGRFHSDWLSMLYPRLRLARNLLKDDGVIFISIDDNEVSNLRLICDEIFGRKNCLGTIVWKKKTNGNNMGSIPPVHDYIVCYAKEAGESCLRGFPVSDEYIDDNYSNSDNDPLGAWTTSDLSANHKGPSFSITNPVTGKIYDPPGGRYWVFNEREVKKRIADGRIIFGKTGKAGPVQKKYLSERDSMRRKAESWWDSHGLNSDGTEEMASFFVPKIFDHSKPSVLLKHLCDISTQESDVVLDLFAGSGTMGQAVIEQNQADGAKRRFILVQVGEKFGEDSVAFREGITTVSDLAMERIRRAGAKAAERGTHTSSDLDIGFRSLRVDTSNMEDVYHLPESLRQSSIGELVENIKPERSSEDLLFQVLLDWGVDLSLPINCESIDNSSVYFVDETALAACFESNVSEELVTNIAKRNPVRAVFRDLGYRDDSIKINVDQIFKTISPNTDVKSI